MLRFDEVLAMTMTIRQSDNLEFILSKVNINRITMNRALQRRAARRGGNPSQLATHCYLQQYNTSTSRMRVINHNWSTTKQRIHPQSVGEISRHSVLSGDRIRQCSTSSGSRHKDTVCKSPFPSAGTAVSLFHVKTVQQRPLLPREVETRLPDCGVTHQVRIDHMSRLPVMPPSTFDVNWLQIQPQRFPGCQSQQWCSKDIRLDWSTVMFDDFLHQLVSRSLPSQIWRFNVGEHWERCRTEGTSQYNTHRLLQQADVQSAKVFKRVSLTVAAEANCG